MYTHLYPLLDKGSEPQLTFLDLPSGHMERRMHTLIASRGYIPLVYCGGTTLIEQMNDTHFHARIVEQINGTYLHARIDMSPVERNGSGWDEEGEENSVAFEAESDA